MTEQEKRTLDQFPESVDRAVRKKFGQNTECKTTWSIVQNDFVTYFEAKGQKKKQIESYINGWMDGNKELAHRLLNQ